MRVVICSRVSRALLKTSVESAEVARVVIGLVATAHSVPIRNRPRTAPQRAKAQWLRCYLTAGAVQCSQRLLDAT